MQVVHNRQNIRILIVEDQFIEAHDLQIIIEAAGYEATGIARSFNEAIELIAEIKPDLVFLDIYLKGSQTGIDLARELKDSNIGFIFISANSGKKTLDEAKKTQPYGFIVKPFREQDILTTLEIACFRHKFSLESQLKQENILRQKINGISESGMKWGEALLNLGAAMQMYLPFDYFEVGRLDPVSYTTQGLLRKNFEEYQLVPAEKISKISEMPLSALARLQYWRGGNGPLKIIDFYTASKQPAEIHPYKKIILQSFGIRSFITIDIQTNDDTFCFGFYSRQADSYEKEQVRLLNNLQSSLLKFVQSQVAEKPSPNDAVPIPKIIDAIQDDGHVFKNMAGNSKSMFTVFDYVRKVAPSDTSVLILGESGTGKEKVAQCIHRLSKRNGKSMVVINCGAIPENLAESILFGHEKGAFTGAVDQRIGKFELADGGTIFLDEIGEMSNELQVKLLRVLQEREIERVGGRLPIPVDVRIIAATNRNLEEQVASGNFRLDLYYRLHVFPIVIPSLRDRKEDIPELANYFMKAYCAKTGRNVLSLSQKAVNTLLNFNWPGNIRELEHTIQRSILMCEGNIIDLIHLSNNQEISLPDPEKEESLKTIEQYEREYITFVIKKCNGKISGAGGAAEILDMPPSTLNSRIKKLGIKISG